MTFSTLKTVSVSYRRSPPNQVPGGGLPAGCRGLRAAGPSGARAPRVLDAGSGRRRGSLPVLHSQRTIRLAMATEPTRQPQGTPGVIHIVRQSLSADPRPGLLGQFRWQEGDGVGAFYLGKATGYDALAALLEKVTFSLSVTVGTTAPGDPERATDAGCHPQAPLIAPRSDGSE